MKLDKLFSDRETAAFMPYVCCGDISAEFTIKLVATLVANGADAIELGIPFSDPIADGKTIQAASSRALAGGMTPKKAVEVIARIRGKGISVPLVVMTYYNIIYANGIENFLEALKNAGADALIAADVPLEESGVLHQACVKSGIGLVYLIAPNSSTERIKEIAEKSSGFLYAVSVLGTTGAKASIAAEALELVKRAKAVSGMPVAVGFGISRPEHASALVRAGADGVIVGSEIIDIYSRQLHGTCFDEKKALNEIAAFAREMKAGCARTSL